MLHFTIVTSHFTPSCCLMSLSGVCQGPWGCPQPAQPHTQCSAKATVEHYRWVWWVRLHGENSQKLRGPQGICNGQRKGEHIVRSHQISMCWSKILYRSVKPFLIVEVLHSCAFFSPNGMQAFFPVPDTLYIPRWIQIRGVEEIHIHPHTTVKKYTFLNSIREEAFKG